MGVRVVRDLNMLGRMFCAQQVGRPYSFRNDEDERMFVAMYDILCVYMCVCVCMYVCMSLWCVFVM